MYGAFEGFGDSEYASGEYFDKYVKPGKQYQPTRPKVIEIFDKYNIRVPDRHDWMHLADEVMAYGLYNRYLQAIPPTGSISYINDATASIHPVSAKIEIRKEGQLGRVYFPAPEMTQENHELFVDAYTVGPEAIIDVYAAASEHVDQGLSLTLFFPDTATTRDINRAQNYAWKKGIKTLYYVRVRQEALLGTEQEGCVSCSL